MSRESEVVAYLRADTTLGTLAPGGIYAFSELSVEGITDPVTTPDVWADGEFHHTLVAKERQLVPTGEIVDLKEKHASASQAIEIYGYARADEAIRAMLNRVYDLMQGHAFTVAWPAEWESGFPILPALELPSGTKVAREDYRIKNIRRPSV